MSLINKMLQDLEKRRQKFVGQGAVSAMTPTEEGLKPERVSRKKLFISIVSICVIVIVFSGIVVFKAKSHVAKSNLLPLPAPVISQVLNDSVSDVAVARLEQVTVTQSGKLTNVTFNFNQVTQYQLNETEDGIDIELMNAMMGQALPNLPEATAIETWDSASLNDNLIIHLKLLADTEITSVVADTQSGSMNLNIVFNNPNLLISKKVLITPERQANQYYADAMAKIAEGNVSAAQKSLESALAIMPNLVPARVALASLLINNSQPAQAEILVSQGLTLLPGNITLLELKARSLLDQGQLENALNVLESANPAIRSAPSYYALMAILELQLGDAQSAEEYYNQLLAIEPKHSIWWMGLATAHQAQGEYNQAVSAYERALSTGELPPALIVHVNQQLEKLGVSKR